MPINYKEYCKDWKLRSKFIRFYRAKNKCEWCGVENYTINDRGSKVILTVAHLDHNKSNNSFFNLRALCQGCHLRYDIKRHVFNRWKNKHKDQRKLFDLKEQT